MVGVVREISYAEAKDFILCRHYSGRMPAVSIAFGWFVDRGSGLEMVAACTFGKPASHTLCEGICGKKWSRNVYELNRLVRVDDFKKPLSQFVSCCLRYLKKNNWIIVSYADSGMHHHGYIYQALNFMYTGRTKRRTDPYDNAKHARHTKQKPSQTIRQVRTPKYRYVYFCTNDKKLKREWTDALHYKVLPYPKGDNQNYKLGTIYKPELVYTTKANEGA